MLSPLFAGVLSNGLKLATVLFASCLACFASAFLCIAAFSASSFLKAYTQSKLESEA